MPKVEALNNFPYEGRMRTKGEKFDLRDDELDLHLELKRVKVLSAARSNSPVTNNRQLEGGVDKTTRQTPPSTQTAPASAEAQPDKKAGNPVPPMTTQDVSGRDLVANSTAARRASGKVATGSTAAPAGAASSKAGKNDDGSPSKQ